MLDFQANLSGVTMRGPTLFAWQYGHHTYEAQKPS